MVIDIIDSHAIIGNRYFIGGNSVKHNELGINQAPDTHYSFMATGLHDVYIALNV